MKVHNLKCHDVYYKEVIAGTKPWEIRKDDRNYQVGDILILHEILPELNQFTGRKSAYVITYILSSDVFLAAGHVCMTIEKCNLPDA